jgi:hypothetical protein
MPDPTDTAPDTIDLSSYTTQKGAPDTISLAPTGQEKPLQNRPDDSGLAGTLKNAGTTTIKGLAHIPGFVGDLSDLSKYVMARIIAGISGTPVEQVMQRQAENERQRLQSTPTWARLPEAPSGHDISAPILKQTGEYQPTTTAGRIGAAAGETGLAMLGPGGVGAGLKAAKAGKTGLDLARSILTGGAKAMPGGAASGAVGDVATQLTGDPLAGIVAGSVLPIGAAVAKPAVRPLVEPFVPSMRQRAANRILTKSATDPEAAIDAVQNRPPKPGETLGEATLDPGLLQAEKGALNTSDHFRAAMADRDAARNEQRTQAINGIAPPADQMAPVKLFRQRLEDIEGAAQDAVDRATAHAKAAHEALPGATPANVSGETLRTIVSEADKAKGAAVSRLYNAVDPEGTLSLVATGPRETATALHQAFDPMVSEPNMATPIIAKMTTLPDVMPFRKLMDLDTTITSKMAEAARSGDKVGRGQLIALKGSVQNAIDSAIENQTKWEQGAVARGEVSQNDTIGARLAEEAQQYVAARKAGRSVSASAVNAGPAGPTRISPAPGGEGETGGRPGVPPGDQGIPGDVPNFDTEAAGRLTAAKTGAKERATTFGAKPIAPTLKTTGFAGQYAMPDAKVPAAAFPKGDIGYSNVRAFLNAAPQSVDALRNIAISRLRDSMLQGTMTPDALAKWKQDYGPALKALNEADPNSGWLTKFHNAAGATAALEDAAAASRQAVTEARTGTAAKFMGLTNPAEVGDTLMGMAKAKNGPTQLTDLMGQMDDAGKAGVRHSLAQTILRDHANADGSLSGAKLRNFITDNGASLEAVYGKPGMDVLSKLAEDAERYQKAQGLQRSKLGSDSFANFMNWAKAKGGGHVTDMSIGFLILQGLEHAIQTGDFHGVALGIGAAGIKAGIGKLRAAGIHKIHDLVELGMRDPEVGSAMMQSALDRKGQFKADALDALAKAVSRSAVERQTLEEHGRLARAAGGKVQKMDHARNARELLGLAEKARKLHQRETKPLLQLPDETVAHALKVANRAVGGDTA